LLQENWTVSQSRQDFAPTILTHSPSCSIMAFAHDRDTAIRRAPFAGYRPLLPAASWLVRRCSGIHSTVTMPLADPDHWQGSPLHSPHWH
jgi:hypothetical protein